jgi:hypothetical protein
MSEPDPQEILKAFSELSPKTMSIIVRWFQSNPSRDPNAPPAPGVSPEEHAAALAEFLSRAMAPAALPAQTPEPKTKKKPRARNKGKANRPTSD